MANAVFEAHCDDSEFGYRFLADEARLAGHVVCDRTVGRVCRDNGWWSVFGKPKNRKTGKPATPAHDDLVRRVFTATKPNELWLTDLTEHRTKERKLYVCAIKDLWSNWIVGYSISDRMKAGIVVGVINNAVAQRGDVAGCVLYIRPGKPVPDTESSLSIGPSWHGRIGGPSRFSWRQRCDRIVLLIAPKKRAGLETLDN